MAAAITKAIVAKAAPCQDFDKLTLLSLLEEKIEELETAAKAEDIERIRTEFAKMKHPFQSLLSSSKRALTDIKQAIKVKPDVGKVGASSAASAGAHNSVAIYSSLALSTAVRFL